MIFPLGSRFFGLTPQYRISLFTQIHEIVFHGKGGYTWETIYNMPIWLRNFTFNKINEFYEDSNNQNKSDVVQESINTLRSAGNTKPITPPSYITKASKK